MGGARKSVAVRIERITKDLLEKYRPVIHDILIRSFYPYETISNAYNVSRDPEAQAQLNLLVDDMLQDEASLVARRAEDNAIVGVAINKILTKCKPGEETYYERFTSEHVTNPSARLFLEFGYDEEHDVDLFDEMKVDRMLDMLMLCVVREARGLGVGKALVVATQAVAKELDIFAVATFFTASTSQAIGKAAGFRVFQVYPHNKFVFNGVPLSTYLRDDQQFSQLCGKIVA